MNAILILISLLVTVAYLVYTVKLFGVPWSISETYYLLEKRKSGSGIFFTLWAWAASLPLLVAWLNILAGKPYQFLAFLACGALLFVGAAAQFKQKLTDKVHYISAGICVASALTSITLVGYWYIPAVMLALCLGQAYLDKKIVLWIEIGALVATYFTLLIY